MIEFANSPYGGTLVDLREHGDQPALIRFVAGLPTIQLSTRQLSELAMLASGMLSPLNRYLNRIEVRSVLLDMRLPDGTLFSYPLLLDVASKVGFRPGDRITLRNAKNNPVAWMEIEEIFELPVSPLLASRCKYGLSGQPRVIDLPRNIDFPSLRRMPWEMRADIARLGSSKVIGFPFSGPMSRADEQVLNETATRLNAIVLAQPILNSLKPFDIQNFLHARICATVVERYLAARGRILLRPSLPKIDPVRDFVMEAIVQRNFGATHVAAHDSLPAAQLLEIQSAASEVGIDLLPITAAERNHDGEAKRDLHPETQAILSHAYPERIKQGFCLWLTGLPSAGKSTIAELVATKLLEEGRQITVLDGDVVRTHLSHGLGFSKEDRNVNILRIGFVASEIVRHHGIVICATVSPYRETRNKVRQMIGTDRFIEIFVDAPLSVCESRDVKGYYAQARSGELKSFTGVSDPYEAPVDCEVRLNSDRQTPEASATQVILYLALEGFIPAASSQAMAAVAGH